MFQALLSRGAPSASWYTPEGKVITPLQPDYPDSGRVGTLFFPTTVIYYQYAHKHAR